MSQEAHLTLYSPEPLSPLAFPFADEGIKAGFPSPAQDYMEERIDLNRIVVRSPETTFYARVSGSSLRDAGILDGDLVVIDKSLAPRDGDYIAACVDGEFTLKQFRRREGEDCAWLVPANPAYKPIRVDADSHFLVWGVLTYCVHRLRA